MSHCSNPIVLSARCIHPPQTDFTKLHDLSLLSCDVLGILELTSGICTLPVMTGISGLVAFKPSEDIFLSACNTLVDEKII